MNRRFGKYTLVDRLGGGGMAAVFKARLDGPGGFTKHLAVKMILPNISNDPFFIDMFVQEASLSANLDHNNITRVYEFDRIRDLYYIAMELVDGCDLRALLMQCKQMGRKLTVTEALFIGVEICKGLAYAHGEIHRGEPEVIHRDISPQNIMLSRSGEVKITDFGIAKIAASMNQTKTGHVKGNFSYMSPEQALGGVLDRRTDIFSAGCVLWEILAGRKLFANTRNPCALGQLMPGPVEPPSVYNKAVPGQLDQVILHALDKYPKRRIGSASELGHRLEEVLESIPGARRFVDLAGLYRELFVERVKSGTKFMPSVDTANGVLFLEHDEVQVGNEETADSHGPINAGVTRPDIPAPCQDDGTLLDVPAGGVTVETGAEQPIRSSSENRRTTACRTLNHEGKFDEISPPKSPGPCSPSPIGSQRRRSLIHLIFVVCITALAAITTAAALSTTPAIIGGIEDTGTTCEPPGAHESRGNEPVPGPKPTEALIGPHVALAGISDDDAGGERPSSEIRPSASSPKVQRRQPEQRKWRSRTSALPSSTKGHGEHRRPCGVVLRETAEPTKKKGPGFGRLSINAITNNEPLRESGAARPLGLKGARRPWAGEENESYGYLSINAIPWAEVFRDGKSVGDTPLENLKLPAGKHTLVLVNKELGVKKEVQVEIRKGKLTKKVVDLRK